MFSSNRESKKDNLFYYALRHGDDWGIPLTIEDHVGVNFYGTLMTIEDHVGVNFYGTLISKQAIDIQEDKMNLDSVEQEIFTNLDGPYVLMQDWLNHGTFPSQEKVKQLKKKYSPGTAVSAILIEDPYIKISSGEKGTVKHVDDAGTIHVIWNRGLVLGVFEGEIEIDV